ncbi:hypothetical protein BDD12DRAFT_730317, partial [Trichophaea hybrida]
YWKQRRWKEAEELLAHNMEAFKTILNQEHSNALCCMYNLNYIYGSKGRIDEATAFMESIAALESRILSGGHHSTRFSTDDLAGWKDRSGAAPT